MVFGDYILVSYDNGSGLEVGAFLVTVTHSQHHETTLDLTINGEVVHTTDEHPFLVMDGETTRWVEAGQLNIGDTVLAADGTTGIVEAVEVVDEPQTMYNLTVALAATYLVGSGQWVVHNQDIPIGFNPQQWQQFQTLAEGYAKGLTLPVGGMPGGTQLSGKLIVQGSRVPGAVDRLTGVPNLPRLTGNLSDIDLLYLISSQDMNEIAKTLQLSRMSDETRRILGMISKQNRLDPRGFSRNWLGISPNHNQRFWHNFANKFMPPSANNPYSLHSLVDKVQLSIAEQGGNFDPSRQPFVSPTITIGILNETCKVKWG